MEMDLRTPIRIKFDAKENKDGTWDLDYEEYFHPDDKVAFQNSIGLIDETNQELNPTMHDDHVSLNTNNMKKEQLYTILVSEFIANSMFSTMTVNEMLVFAGLGAGSYLKTIENTSKEFSKLLDFGGE